jgi:hypothetical protein
VGDVVALVTVLLVQVVVPVLEIVSMVPLGILPLDLLEFPVELDVTVPELELVLTLVAWV